MLTVDTTTPDMSDRDVRLKSVCILLNPALGLLRKNPAPTPLSIRRIERHCRSALRADSESLLQFSGSPEDRTRHNSVISRVWATSPRLPGFIFSFPHSSPLANCASLSQWFGRRSNPHLLGFNQSLYRLSYRTRFCLGYRLPGQPRCLISAGHKKSPHQMTRAIETISFLAKRL